MAERSRIIKMALEADSEGWIRGRLFEDALILGPAVLYVAKGNLVHESILGVATDAHGHKVLDSIIWEIPRGKVVVGCIGIEDCKFQDCTFRDIGFAGTPDTIKQFWAASYGEAPEEEE